jgi:8-oxo-dGTP pyrophosphatase MutT (NUDIX family)
VPVCGTDAHLACVPDERLSPEALRLRFPVPPTWRPEIDGDRGQPRDTMVGAAVLVPLVDRPAGVHVLLTRRTDHLRRHAGQVSFPGGRADPADADETATALREADEEIGLPRERVEVLGTLPAYLTITGFAVRPVVALVHPPFDLRIDQNEVAETFEVPLRFLMDPRNHRRHELRQAQGARAFLSMPWTQCQDDGQQVERFIWGATASMLRNLYGLLASRAEPR